MAKYKNLFKQFQTNPCIGQKAYRSLRGIRKTPVDIVVGYESDFERLKNQPTIEREVSRDGILLYEK